MKGEMQSPVVTAVNSLLTPYKHLAVDLWASTSGSWSGGMGGPAAHRARTLEPLPVLAAQDEYPHGGLRRR